MDDFPHHPDASPLMKQGIALLNENTAASLTEAVALFDRALEIRRATLPPGDHWAAYLTAASWMNRGDALTRLAQPSGLAEAVHSYDEAVALMREVPLDINPLYRRRLAIAWMNRGITLQQFGTAESFARAAESFEQGIDIVRDRPEHALLLAGAWMNRGNALLHTTPARPAEAWAAAVSALEVLGKQEPQDLLAVETALKARHVICQAIAELLPADRTIDAAPELISAATDAVEEGLRLARHWVAAGEARFRPLLVDYFRFGLVAYRAYQPHFLAEFVADQLDATRPHGLADDLPMHQLAAETLRAAAGDLQEEGFKAINTPRFDAHLKTLGVLQFVEGRIAILAARSTDII